MNREVFSFAVFRLHRMRLPCKYAYDFNQHKVVRVLGAYSRNGKLYSVVLECSREFLPSQDCYETSYKDGYVLLR